MRQGSSRRNINQSLTGSCKLKTTTPAGRDSLGCCSIQAYARTARRKSTKAPKHQNSKAAKQQSENEKRRILTYNRTDINGRDDEKS
jgi:hypothetical protein